MEHDFLVLWILVSSQIGVGAPVVFGALGFGKLDGCLKYVGCAIHYVLCTMCFGFW